ncbi:hypothetical protein PoB_006054500 [Plakobranchus ocellatus]|uniref:Uncharacterized protein n=1 Tax=Plakobranchus ocellatus TaxID=259542 RepID=A0AAV4CQC1_9GAST|nr:hypothetical protein PoB_006054500 [Plakobranchus ocellatus]
MSLTDLEAVTDIQAGPTDLHKRRPTGDVIGENKSQQDKKEVLHGKYLVELAGFIPKWQVASGKIQSRHVSKYAASSYQYSAGCAWQYQAKGRQKDVDESRGKQYHVTVLTFKLYPNTSNNDCGLSLPTPQIMTADCRCQHLK